jgi:hypothetical protein
MDEGRIRPQPAASDAAHHAAHADALVDAHAAALFNSRYAYVAVLADPSSSAAAIEKARKAHAEARNVYDAVYMAAYDAARGSWRKGIGAGGKDIISEPTVDSITKGDKS